MDGFTDLITKILTSDGVPEPAIYEKSKLELPGFFRAEKKWDLVIVVKDRLLAAIELKSQVGPSFGNNFNNRSEEAIGSASDFRAAYREGAFKPSIDPWLGYLMLLEDARESRSPVRVYEPHFSVFAEFKSASYQHRYEILLTKLIRERLYDAACLLVSPRGDGLRGIYREPIAELGIRNFIESIRARALAFCETHL